MMKAERWQQIDQIFQCALECAPAQRRAFLDEACAGDEELRREVESLLCSDEQAGSFIERPAIEEDARLLVNHQAAAVVGQRIGQYEIMEQLGRGGMGEVYLAHDTRLGRKIALKLLPTHLSRDKDRLRRFEQEARAASALNHPNILTIYEIGQISNRHFIATEYVEGDTLRQRLTSGQRQISEALDVTMQMASALAAAHETGIIHRDIKPENIILRSDGYVKVLDFGLAKLIKQQSSAPEKPTLPFTKTDTGLVIGTTSYMSPEQARGLAVDTRTDIWSLGVVLQEMITGQSPFAGPTTGDTIVNILEHEPPPLSEHTADAPAELQRIIRKTLRKDPEARYQTSKELLFDLKNLKHELEHATTSMPAPRSTVGLRHRHKRAALLLVTGLLALLAIGAFIFRLVGNRSRADEAPAISRVVQITSWAGLDFYPALSPDGNTLAFSSDRTGSFEIYVKQLAAGAGEVQLTADGGQNFEPAFSPRGDLLAYCARKRGGIWVVPVTGGNPRQLTEFGSHPAWSPDGSQIAFQSAPSGNIGFNEANAQPPSTIWLISAEGGEPKQLTQAGNPVGGHGAPSWSPDGKRIVFDASNFGDYFVWSVSVQGSDVKKTSGKLHGIDAVYAPDGKAIYFVSDSGGTLQKVNVSAAGDPIGEPVKIIDASGSHIRQISIAAGGKRIVYSALSTSSDIWSTALSPAGESTSDPPSELTHGRNTYDTWPAFSPDGKRIAYVLYGVGRAYEVWVMDANGKHQNQLTDDGFIPCWYPDGNRVAFISGIHSHPSYCSVTVEGGKKKKLFDFDGDVNFARLSPDGKQVAFQSTRSGTRNVWLVSIEGGEPKQLTFDKESAGFPAWSPDGKWLAFEVAHSGGSYIALIPSTGGEPMQLTFDKGEHFIHDWSPDGDKIIFAGQRDDIWNVYWVSRSTKQQKQLTRFTKLNAYVRSPAWSPLNDRIAYEYAETTGNIWMLELK
jgi:Tol biopolymer transport system component/serine/threonine protein kinase